MVEDITKITKAHFKEDYSTFSADFTKLDSKYMKLEKVFADDKLKWEWAAKKIGVKKITPAKLEELCIKDVNAFWVFMLGVVPRPHQIYINDSMKVNKRLAMSLSRRLGKTRLNRHFVEWAVIFNKFPAEDGGTTFTIICQDLDVGKDLYIQPLFLDLENADFTTNINFKGYLGKNYFTSKLITRKDKYGKVAGNKVSFNLNTKSNSKQIVGHIQVVPPTNKARGREGNILGDEVSFWKYNNACKNDIEFYDTVIDPILSDNPNYIAIMSSTPDGYGDLWEHIFDPNNTYYSDYAKVWFPCWVYRKEEYIKAMKTLRLKFAKKGEFWKFQQEYEARFIKARDQYFDEDKHINRLFNDDNILQQEYSTQEGYICVDFGGTMTSHSVISYITKMDDINKTNNVIFTKEFKVNEDETLFEEIIDFTKRYPNYIQVVVDNKGGRYIVQRLQQQLSPLKVFEFNFSTLKVTGYATLKQNIALNRIKAYNNEKLKLQLRNFNDKLKPNIKEISDDILDTIMMGNYVTSIITNNKEFTVIQY